MSVANSRIHRSLRSGYTLIEVVMSLTSASILTAGLATSIAISSRSLTGGGKAVTRAKSAEVQANMLADLNQATAFSARTATSVTFTVPDRDADNLDETISYSWTGLPSARLTYSYNGSAPTTILNDIQDLQLTYAQRSIAGASSAPLLPDSTQWGTRWASGLAVFGYEPIFSSPRSNQRKQIATKVTLNEAGTLSSITAHLTTTSADNYRFAIYTHESFKNRPGLLLAQTANGNSIVDGWVTLPTPAVLLAAGTYWLALSYDDKTFVHREQAGGETEISSTRATQSGYSLIWGNSSSSEKVKISIYANYTPN